MLAHRAHQLLALVSYQRVSLQEGAPFPLSSNGSLQLGLSRTQQPQVLSSSCLSCSSKALLAADQAMCGGGWLGGLQHHGSACRTAYQSSEGSSCHWDCSSDLCWTCLPLTAAHSRPWQWPTGLLLPWAKLARVQALLLLLLHGIGTAAAPMRGGSVQAQHQLRVPCRGLAGARGPHMLSRRLATSLKLMMQRGTAWMRQPLMPTHPCRRRVPPVPLQQMRRRSPTAVMLRQGTALVGAEADGAGAPGAEAAVAGAGAEATPCPQTRRSLMQPKPVGHLTQVAQGRLLQLEQVRLSHRRQPGPHLYQQQ